MKRYLFSCLYFLFILLVGCKSDDVNINSSKKVQNDSLKLKNILQETTDLIQKDERELAAKKEFF